MLSRLRTALRALLRRSQAERELDEELRYHIERQTEQNIRLGMNPEEARYASRKAFGGVEQAKERSRDARGVRWLEELWQDLRYGARAHLKNPGFTLVAMITLALGIGANSAIFSVINALLLRPLSYAAPERLVMVWESFPGSQENPVMPANFADWRAQNQVFTDMAAWAPQTINLSGDGNPEKVEGAGVTANLFALLGMEPFLGRAFLAEEDRPGVNQVVMISHGLWQRRFGGSRDAIGRRVTLEGTEFTIIGVAPPSFHFPSRQHAVWIPLALSPEQTNARVAAHYLNVIARLKPDASLQQAQAEMAAVAARLEQQYPNTNATVRARVVPLKEQIVGNFRKSLFILFAAAGFVLLVACANVANLLLFRASIRQKEIAVRLAIGAGRGRMMRQLLTESLLLAALGGALGLFLAWWGVSALTAVMPERLALFKAAKVDQNVLAFTLAASMLTAIFFGLFPAFQATRLNLNEALKEGGREAAQGRNGLRSLLVVAEVALAMTLMAGAGLTLNSFLRLRQVDAGFNADRLLAMEVDPTFARYPGHSALAAFYDRLLERIEALPGVESAGVVTRLPLTGDSNHYLYMAESESGWKPVTALPASVSPGYFHTMGIPLVAGRSFTARDGPQTESVVVINEAMAEFVWPNQNPLGKRIVTYPYNSTAPMFTVAGVIKDVRQSELQTTARPQVYHSCAQMMWFPPRDLVVRTNVAPLDLAAAVRDAIRSVDKDQPVSNIRTMDRILADSIADERFNTSLLAIYAALALALAGVGIYGVMSYLVTQYTREIGVRMALGAQTRDVLGLVFRQGMTLTLTGAAIGLGAALGLTRLIKNMLFVVSPTDPVTFFVIALLLAMVALLACYLPARRATKVDPLVALKAE